MIKGIIFDLGSTLAYYDGNWEEVNQSSTESLMSFLNANGIVVGSEFPTLFYEHRQRGWKLAEETEIEHTVEEALHGALTQLGYHSFDGLLPRAVQAFFAPIDPHWHAYPDAIATLQELKRRGLRIGLISNADDNGVVHRTVERDGFAPYLLPVLSSAAEPRWRKPDPRIFHLVSATWQIAPSDIAMIGDAPRYDVLGAHRAGMRGILIDRGDNAPWQEIPDELANEPAVRADATVHALAEIPGVIERM